MKKLFLFLFLACVFSAAYCQTDSCGLRISLLTCSPGEDLYSRFGHTALRVQDANAQTDEVFNYGTFEFDDDFYMKFIRGKLLYSLSVESFDEFMYQYKLESRSVKEQQLLLSCEEKKKLLNALLINASEANRHYRYDFLFDNCTTRAGRIVEKNVSTPVAFENILPSKPPSFRDMIHEYLDAGNEYWSKLGIDILLGASLDRKVTNDEAIHFLPDYLLKGFEHASVNQHPLVSSAQIILDMPPPEKGNSIFRPAVVFSLLLILGVMLTFLKSKWAQTTLSILDFLFFFILGLAGLLLIFMWFGTDHKVCANNYNLLWALPSNLMMAFFVHSNRAWVKKYFRIICCAGIVMLLGWFFLPQQMNPSLIPILALIIFRSWFLSKNK